MEPEPHDLTPWDRRVIRAIDISNVARKGAQLLRIAAGVIAIATLVGAWLTTFSDGSFGDSDTRYKIGAFIGSVVGSLTLAGLLVAASLLVDLYASRLDLDIVLADEDEASASDSE